MQHIMILYTTSTQWNDDYGQAHSHIISSQLPFCVWWELRESTFLANFQYPLQF